MNLNLKAKQAHTYDAIVIGSGISGGWAAKELCEKGLKTLMLERGKQLEHVKDYETATKAPWEIKHRGRLTVKQREEHKYLVRMGVYSEFNEKYWINDSENPYIEEKPFDWARPDIVGGRSIMWGRGTLRLSEMDFQANARDGMGIPWPVGYRDIAPWYDYVEEFAGISGQNEGLPQLPDGKFQPPMEMNCFEKSVKSRLEKAFPERKLIMYRMANLTEPLEGRAKCQFRNLCNRGCPYGAYFSTQSSTLPAAIKTGNLTLRPDSIVNSIIYDQETGRATGVRVIDKHTKEWIEYYARIIFLNASALGSTFILMNSISDRFPNGLGNDSGVLGHYLMDHHFQIGASGESDEFADKYYYGRRPIPLYVPRFRNIGNDKREYLRGYGYTTGSSRTSWARVIPELGIGADFKEASTEPGPWRMGMTGFGECLPYFDNQVSLDHSQKDPWGQPVLKFNCDYRENEMAMRKDMASDAAEMLEAGGLKNVQTYDAGARPGRAIHEMGTARMGLDPKTSVLNKWNQVHSVKNVFVTDGAFMTSSACQNPSLTYMAFTARAADYAVRELKRQNL